MSMQKRQKSADKSLMNCAETVGQVGQGVLSRGFDSVRSGTVLLGRIRGVAPCGACKSSGFLVLLIGVLFSVCLSQFASMAAAAEADSASVPSDAEAMRKKVVAHVLANPGGEQFNTIDLELYQRPVDELKDLPIGVFDSGIGGLTVLEAILQVDVFDNETGKPGADGVPDFAAEKFIYLGDQANMPYGRYPSVGKELFLRELILKDAIFLMGKRWRAGRDQPVRLDKPPVKALVIACNTATAFGLEDLKKAVAAWGVPVIVVGVVNAGARGLLSEADQWEAGAVGVMATPGTCASGAYPAAIRATLGRAGRAVPAITQQGGQALAAVIEGNPAFTQSLDEQAYQDALELVKNHRESGAKEAITTVMLGCTHYPLAISELEAGFDRVRAEHPDLAAWIGKERRYVDPAEWAARELFNALSLSRLRIKPKDAGDEVAPTQFFISVPGIDAPTQDGGLQLDYQYGRQPGHLNREDTVVVELSRARLPKSGAGLVKDKLPAVWARMKD